MTVIYTWGLLLACTIIFPLWWHRRRQQNSEHTIFAAAQFLPAAQASQKRVWRWQHYLLLALRMMILLLLTALLSDWSFAFRQHTHLMSLARVQTDNTLKNAYVFCTQPDDRCDILTDDMWLWLAEHEREWSPDAALTLQAYADELAMPALRPRYAHPLQLEVTQRENADAPLNVAIVSDDNIRQTLQKELLASGARIRLLTQVQSTVDLALYVGEPSASNSVDAKQHIVFSDTLNRQHQFKTNNTAWSYVDNNNIRYYQTKLPDSANQWRDFLAFTAQLNSAPFITPTTSTTLAPELSEPRRWPSNALHDIMILLMLITLLCERVVHHALARSR